MRIFGFILEALVIGATISFILVACAAVIEIPVRINAQTSAYLCVESWKLGDAPEHCEQFKDGQP